jgi:hypothetical protein
MKRVNMKLFAFVSASLISSNLLFGQNISDKSIQAGLTGTFGLNSLRMGTSKMNANGLGSNLGIGIVVHSALKNSKNLGIASGLDFEFGTFKFVPATATYYNYNDKAILSDEDAVDATGVFQLTERTQKPVYLTVPLMFLFRTDFIGEFRYFGKFGIRNSFLVSNKMNDTGIDITSPSQSTELLNMKSTGETFFYNGSVGMTAGAEWNFVSSTSLVAELGYFYGITPLFFDRKEKNSLYTTGSLTPSYFSNNANLNQILFKISILF